MHWGAKASALLTPLHGTTGCGAFQRRSPAGGAANGMPLNTFTPFQDVPEIWPLSILTIAGGAERSTAAVVMRTTAKIQRRIPTSLPGNHTACAVARFERVQRIVNRSERVFSRDQFAQFQASFLEQ